MDKEPALHSTGLLLLVLSLSLLLSLLLPLLSPLLLGLECSSSLDAEPAREGKQREYFSKLKSCKTLQKLTIAVLRPTWWRSRE